MRYLIYIIVLLILSACAVVPIQNQSYVPYTIFPPLHESYEAPYPLFKDYVKWSFKTDKSWDWPYRNHDDGDWSKVGGIYWGYIHWNSVRIVMRQPDTNGTKQLGYYIYENGNSPQSDYGKEHKLSRILISVKEWEHVYHCYTGWEPGNWVIEINELKIKIPTTTDPRAWNDIPVEKGFAFPYAGGDNPPPHTWTIYLKTEK